MTANPHFYSDEKRVGEVSSSKFPIIQLIHLIQKFLLRLSKILMPRPLINTFSPYLALQQDKLKLMKTFTGQARWFSW